jgi:hypothetical protein
MSSTSTPQSVFRAWSLVQLRAKFTVYNMRHIFTSFYYFFKVVTEGAGIEMSHEATYEVFISKVKLYIKCLFV